VKVTVFLGEGGNVKEFQGKIDSKSLKIAIVVSQFNLMITERLLQGALDVLRRTGIAEETIRVVRVPGSFEIPLAAQRLAQTEKFDAIVCLGSVIRGETPHFDHICRQVTRGIGEVALKFNLPVTYGVITADTVEQAMNRAGLKYGNKGADAAVSAIEMANLIRELTADDG
jgi:6,7-dimethyl-8-ribityllumazine synthase